ncbi:MAG: outer membrane protein assembly factor BamD [SAR324 cluster bacterium]|nr:outer membrane protein assembly factor BamD [SAR324 cluster bacterium]
MKNFSLKSILAAYLLLTLGLSSCSTVEPKTVEAKYDKAMVFIEKGEYNMAPPVLQEILRESPGTRYATYSYLKLGDCYLEIGDTKDNFDQAEVHYRIFLRKSPNSHLVPYVLSRLIELNYKRNISKLWGDEYAFSRDPGHFKSIIHDYQTFYLLYPSSLYLADAQDYRNKALEALAEHEFIIGTWYYGHKLFPSSIARYSHILKVYPNFSGRDKVVFELINAYRKNQQPSLATELESQYRGESQVSSL